MKTMKKICYLIIMCMFLYTSNANASYAYQWNIDGENLSKGQTNKNGTASWIEDDKYTGGILVLNNYNGGEIKLERIGTGLNHVFAIKLIGDNKIMAKGEEGIITNSSELKFIGDGQLTINAKKPITGGKVDNNLFLNTNIVIGSLNETSNDKTIDKDISGNDKNIEKTFIQVQGGCTAQQISEHLLLNVEYKNDNLILTVITGKDVTITTKDMLYENQDKYDKYEVTFKKDNGNYIFDNIKIV